MKVYIERNNFYDTSTLFYFIHVYVCEATNSMQYRPPNAYQEVSNTNHFGSVSDGLGLPVGSHHTWNSCPVYVGMWTELIYDLRLVVMESRIKSNLLDTSVE